ncbi:YaiI/YqxD family protein [Mesorhizobium sp. CC13]|uniref:YaiI/YqxD family protein n=1 Tax=Mesorhizobium sp. CC13 TaxID=3029194 RepID=UPI003262F8F3
MTDNKPIIYVDADACPVKDEVVKVGERLDLVVTFVSNGGLRPSRDPMIRNVVVSKGADAADDWIVENARANDIVVTADIPLAARTVALGAHVLGPTGRPFTPETIGMAVAMRDLKQHLRETGESKGYNAGFTPQDRSRFLGALDQTARRAIRGAQGG